jgi:hypothetical protein
MAQLFAPGTNAVVRTVLLACGTVAGVALFAVWAFARSPAATGQYRTTAQPVPFAHALHVTGLQIDCRYCHAGAERAAMAGLPPTEVCVPCHMTATVDSSLFLAVRDSLASGRPIPWHRVNTLPDFVFFNHAVHVRNGIDCETCHGPVHEMKTVYQAAPLTMEWCLQCHRDPAHYIAPQPTRVPGWKRGSVPQGRAVAARYDVQRLTSCSTCHR